MTDEPIIATKDRPGSYDAIETAKLGEPLFPIQGGDPFGPATVLHWVELCRAAGLAETDEKIAKHLLQKATQAEMVAWAMQAYQKGEEELAGTRARYNDDEIEANEEQRTLREALILGAGKLNNALAIAVEVGETLAGLKTHTEEQVLILEGVEKLKAAAFAIEPRRGNQRS